MVGNVRTLLDQIMYFEIDVTANTVCPDIVLEVFLNEEKIYQSNNHQSVHTIAYEISEDAKDHSLKLIMNGKNRTHTKVDSEGQIVKDVYLEVTRIEFEGLDVRNNFCLGQASYVHSFNSTQPEIVDEFYGMMGCNGTVEIKFSTPIFLWLSENLE